MKYNVVMDVFKSHIQTFMSFINKTSSRFKEQRSEANKDKQED